MDTVHVVGTFRQSLVKALEEKRSSTDQIDSIVAEDIGKFPDLNLAESLQRIPGVSIDRDAGEGRQITVRGLGPDFTRVRINGMEAVSTTGGTDSSGGANRGRGFDFNVFASELFSNLTVRKTQSAEVDEGSLGATVDLRAARPFDYDGFTATVSAQAGYNDLSGSWDPRTAALISNTWADGRVGALLSLAYSERGLLEEGFSAVRWEDNRSSGGFCSPVGVTPQNPPTGGGATATACGTGVPRPASTPGGVAAYNTAMAPGVFHPRLPRYGRLTHEQERTGVTGSLQFKVSDDTTLSLDAMYSRFDATRQEDFLETISFSRTGAQGGKPQTEVVAAEVDGRGNLVYGVFNNVDVRSESRFDDLSTKFTQFTLDLDHEFNDQWSMNARVGRADSEFRNPVQTTVTLDIQNIDGYSWDFRGNDRTPVITYPFDVNSAGAWQWISSPGANSTGTEIRIRPLGTDNTFDTAQLNLAFDANEYFTFKGGVSWKEFQFDTFELRRPSETVVPALPPGVTVGDISRGLSGFGKGLGQPSGNAGGWLIPDLETIARLFNIYCNCNTGVPGGDFTLTSVTNGNARGNNRSVEEEDFGSYFQMDFDLDLAGRPLRGNAGIRYASTEITASGFLATGGGTAVTVENEYKDFLPSLNLAWDVHDDVVLRFGAAKVMARPQLPNLSPGGTVNTTLRTVATGNPLLEPFRATTYDFSAEWYFDKDALLSAALFYKDIDSYVQNLRETRPYNTTGLPLDLLGNLPADTPFEITSSVNTPGGPLRGFELNYQQPFSFLDGFWSGFGVLLNYTHVESEIDYAVSPTSNTFVTNDLINLSPDAYNATLYYENETISARVSGAYRDDYLQRVPGQNNNDVEGKHETFNVDFALTWNLNERLSLSLEGINLTDEFNHQFVDSVGDRTSVYHHTGRQFYTGIRYQF